MVVGDVTTAVDVLVLGAGPAGYVAAIRAAQLGRRVTLTEPGPAGGTCLNRGCIPLKALLSSSERLHQSRPEELGTMGIHTEAVSFDWAKMQGWKQSVVERLSDGVRRLISGNRIEVVRGIGWFINAQEARVEGEHGSHRFKFEHCVLATGAEARRPQGSLHRGDGKQVQVITPEQALQFSELPEALGVFGEDYIALELATLFARLGVRVRLFSPGEQILTRVDPAALRLVQAGLRKLGVQITTKASLEKVAEQTEGTLVVSNGVQANTANLHLDAAGVKTSADGGIEVNTMQQSSVPHIYAVGDCTGGQALASVAIKQGKVAAEAISGQRVQFAPLVTPLVVHTTPELATVGLSAEEATQGGDRVRSGRFPLAANGRALTLNSDMGAAFVTASAEDGVLLGVTLVGPRAGDLIGQATLALEMGATLTDLAEILYAHPGLGEGIGESAEQALGRAIHVLMRG